ncbi:hypothetical protein K2173_018513 [Erythroxylum novogranatense]|uniref:Uncharacterized protein n=1 Tax=Erythroxylum novogranatense TaxID=1862640 RepID=A0AAV8UAQ3_9ROSI|nr:hypothetical protein K2173_018513 [Erythroxylum novogranatense]
MQIKSQLFSLFCGCFFASLVLVMEDPAKQSSRSINPWVLNLQKLGLELKCPPCLNLLERPSLLPCNHIICNSCLLKPECPICYMRCTDQDLRPMPLIERIVTIYKNLDATFCSNMLPSSSDIGRTSEQCPSLSRDHNIKFARDSFKTGLEDNSSSGRSVFSLANNGSDQTLQKFSGESGGQKRLSTERCGAPNDGIGKEHEIIAVDGCSMELNPDSPLVSILRAGRPDSPPSFGDMKDSENDSNAHGDNSDYNVFKQSPQNYQPSRLVKRNSVDSTGQERHRCSATEAEWHLRDPKRLKNLNCSNSYVGDFGRADTFGIEYVGGSANQSGFESTTIHPPTLNGSSSMTVCGFCRSSVVSEDTGPMLHFLKGKVVEGDEATKSNVIHVHKMCIDWAPQAYYADEAVQNLKAEVDRGAKLKCTSCGLKGAALGCYVKSCRRSYHVPCAMKTTRCRWDYENYLLLCPGHSSLKFPNERSKSKKLKLDHRPLPTQIDSQPSGFWEGTCDRPKDWVFCGSALSSEYKCLLVKFGNMIDVPVTKFWKPSVTHVIAATNTEGACTRTLKVLMAIVNGRWVLTIDWVKACMETMRAVEEEPYEISLDNHGCHGGPRTGRLRALNNAPKLFNGLHFYFTGDFVRGYKEDLQNLVVAAGGTILRSEQELVTPIQEQADSSRKLVIYNLDPPQGSMLGEEVTIIWQRLNEAQALASKLGFQVVGHTWLLESVAACKLQPVVA